MPISLRSAGTSRENGCQGLAEVEEMHRGWEGSRWFLQGAGPDAGALSMVNTVKTLPTAAEKAGFSQH